MVSAALLLSPKETIFVLVTKLLAFSIQRPRKDLIKKVTFVSVILSCQPNKS